MTYSLQRIVSYLHRTIPTNRIPTTTPSDNMLQITVHQDPQSLSTSHRREYWYRVIATLGSRGGVNHGISSATPVIAEGTILDTTPQRAFIVLQIKEGEFIALAADTSGVSARRDFARKSDQNAQTTVHSANQDFTEEISGACEERVDDPAAFTILPAAVKKQVVDWVAALVKQGTLS